MSASAARRRATTREFCEFLVELGIDSISVTPDTLLKATRTVLDVEQRLGRPARIDLTTRAAA